MVSSAIPTHTSQMQPEMSVRDNLLSNNMEGIDDYYYYQYSQTDIH